MTVSAFNRPIRAGRDLSPAMLAVSEHLKDSVIESFEQEASPDGTPWKPLQLSTQKDRERRGFGPAGPMLVRKGDLIRSQATDHGPDFAQVSSALTVLTPAGAYPLNSGRHQGGLTPPWDPRRGKDVRIQGVSVRATRKPKTPSRSPAVNEWRSAERRSPGLPLQ